jgi:CheY-like chemotaxis protein
MCEKPQDQHMEVGEETREQSVQSERDVAEAADDSAEFVTLHFEVQDTGVGIASEELEKVFDAFTQTESGRKSRQGTGLGLPISREYVRMMGGDLTVESEEGQGTCFRFDIRAELPDQAEIDALRATTASRHVLGIAPGQEAPDGGPYRILVVEDVDASRRLLPQLLRPLGFEVRAAINGQEGVEIWETWQPHLIFMDMGMPVMDGHEATKMIRERTGSDHIVPVIVALTASAFEEDREGILAEGCDEFIRKPFREAKIFDVMREQLGLEFVYADDAEEKTPEVVMSSDDLAVAAAALSGDLREELVVVARNADIGRLNELIETVRAKDASLADALDALAYDFAYGKIQALLEDS